MTTATSTNTEPMDRSRPPEIRTMVGPAARVPRMTAWVRIVCAVSRVRNVPEATAKTA